MSSPSTHVDARSEAADASMDDRPRTALAVSHVLDQLRQVSFWSAIALPFLYVPLVATGLQSTGELWAFLGLLAANVLAVAVGHSYTPD